MTFIRTSIGKHLTDLDRTKKAQPPTLVLRKCGFGAGLNNSAFFNFRK